MSDEDEASERQARDFVVVNQHVKWRLEPVELAYRQSMSSLWLGNGAASLAVLSFIGAALREGKFTHQLLIPLTCFVFGLISMGIGTGSYLYTEGRVILSMERSQSSLDGRVGQAKGPTAMAGLTFRDWRTRMAILSAAFFVLGCIIGMLELWMS